MKVKHSKIQNDMNLFRPKQRACVPVEVVLFLDAFLDEMLSLIRFLPCRGSHLDEILTLIRFLPW